MTQIKATWGWAFNAFPGIEPERGWGSFSDGGNVITLPDATMLAVVSLFLMKPRKLRLQLPLGTPADQFPARITITGKQTAASFAEPGRRQTFKTCEARDYVLLSDRPLGKLVDVETPIAFSWDEFPAPEPEPEAEPERRQSAALQKVVAYDPDTHTLLRDVAHCEYLTAEEYPEFERRCRQYGLDIIQVQMPEWPPVQYSPLALVMNLEGAGDPPWWTTKFWIGMQPAVVTANWVRYTYPDRADIAASMAAGMAGVEHNVRVDTVARYEARMMAGDEFSAMRLAYREQVPAFDPAEHVLVRKWLRNEGLDLVGFYRDFVPDMVDALGFNPVFEVTNPDAREQKETTGSYSAKEDAVAVAHAEAVLHEYRFLCAGKSPRKLPSIEQIEAPLPNTMAPEVPPRPNTVVAGAKTYTARQVAQALHDAFGSLPRMFGGGMADTAIVAMTREGLDAYIEWSDLDRQAYVQDTGGRNYVCDDFALTFKSDAARHFGMNCAGVVWGNGHAWCFVIVVGNDGPEVVFVEPQVDDPRDSEITEFRGAYAIDRRCEVLL